MGPSFLLTTHDQIRKEIYVKVLEFEQDSVRHRTVRIIQLLSLAQTSMFSLTSLPSRVYGQGVFLFICTEYIVKHLSHVMQGHSFVCQNHRSISCTFVKFSLADVYTRGRLYKKVIKVNYRPLAHDVTAPVMMHLEDKLAIYA